jgi:hypothetical protein
VYVAFYSLENVQLPFNLFILRRISLATHSDKADFIFSECLSLTADNYREAYAASS